MADCTVQRYQPLPAALILALLNPPVLTTTPVVRSNIGKPNPWKVKLTCRSADDVLALK